MCSQVVDVLDCMQPDHAYIKRNTTRRERLNLNESDTQSRTGIKVAAKSVKTGKAYSCRS